MAGAILLPILGSAIAGQVGSAIGGALGSLFDSQVLMPALMKKPGDTHPGDLKLTLAAEGTALSYCWGRYARVPAHLIWTSRPWLVQRSGNTKRGVPAAHTYFVHAAFAIAGNDAGNGPGSFILDQLIANSRRVYLRDTGINTIGTTSRASGSHQVGVVGWARNLGGFGASAIVYEFQNTRDLDGNPVEESPDLSVFEVGGKCAIKLNGTFASGSTTTPATSDFWEVSAARVLDANGNTGVSITRSSGGIPAGWAGLFTTSGHVASLAAGVAVELHGKRVPIDTRVLPDPQILGHDPVRVYHGEDKPDLLEDLLDSDNVPFYREHMLVVLEAINLALFGTTFPSWEAIVLPRLTGLPTIINDIRQFHTQLRSDELSTAALSIIDINPGISVPAPFEPVDPLTKVSLVHDLVWQEGTGPDYRGFGRFAYGSERDTAELDSTHLNARRPGDAFAEDDIERFRIDRRERLKRVEVVFDDADDAFQQASEDERAPHIPDGREDRLDLRGCSLSREKGKAIARRLFRESHDRYRGVRFVQSALAWNVQEDDYLMGVVDSAGESTDILVREVTETEDWFYEVEGFAIAAKATGDPSVLTPTETGGRRFDTGEPAITRKGAPIVSHVLDLRPLRDEDVGRVGLYVAASPHDPKAAFEGAVVFIKRPGDNGWQAVASIDRAARMGWTRAALADAADLEDYETEAELEVELFQGALEGLPESMVDAGHNLALVGGEVVGFQAATNDAPGIWTIANLSRGRLDTAAAAEGHLSDEPFVLLDDAVVFVPLSASDLNTTIDVRVVPIGSSIDDVPWHSVTVGGGTVKPLAPANVEVTDNGDDTLSVTWDYRSLRTVRQRAPATSPVAAGDRIVAKLYNQEVGEELPTFELLRTDEVQAGEDAIELLDPGGDGLTGPTVGAVVTVVSSEWGSSTQVFANVSGTFTPTGAGGEVALNDLSDVLAPDPKDGDVLVWDDLKKKWTAARPPEDWGRITDPVTSTEDWGGITDGENESEDWD